MLRNWIKSNSVYILIAFALFGMLGIVHYVPTHSVSIEHIFDAQIDTAYRVAVGEEVSMAEYNALMENTKNGWPYWIDIQAGLEKRGLTREQADEVRDFQKLMVRLKK